MISKNHISLAATLIALLVAVSNSGCGGGTSTTVLPISVSVAASPTSVQAGATAQITATVTNDSANKGVTWTVTCPAAPCGTVSPATTASGAATTYTPPTMPPSGGLTVTITATAVADTSKSSSATITVTVAPLAITVSVAPSTATVQASATAQFTATVTNDSANKGVTWKVTCSVAPCGTVAPAATASGAATTYTAPASPPSAGLTVTVTATSVADTSKSASTTITIPASATTLSVSVTPSTATVQAGATAQFVATVANDPANKGVTWTVSCPTPPCGTVSPTVTASGGTVTYTAPATPPAFVFTVTVTATSVSNASAFAAATVNVPEIIVSVTNGPTTVLAGGTTQFTATVINDPPNKGVTWAVSCPAAPCGTISPSATASGAATTYTAPATPPASDLRVTVTVTCVDNPSESEIVILTVPAIKVSATPSSALLPVKITQQFTATINNDPGTQGVNWALTQGGTVCSPACGAISATSSASGTPITYTAPATVPTSPSVTLTATSVTDTTKSAGATITISSGTVKIVPNILAFGSVKFSKTKTMMATLTNTGSTTLSITSITVTGANPDKFPQTNTCGTSVGAGAPCTITVTFTPKTTGSFSANVAISDSSSDSPQQLTLSGTGTTRFLSVPAVQSALATNRTAAVPNPTGPSHVGTRVMDLIDSKKDDPYWANGTKRELLVRFWYPADVSQGCKAAEYTTPRVWSYFSQLAGIPLPEVRTNSCLDAPITAGAHPVIVFTHGYTGTFTDYTFLFEDLASRGYVVASVNHTHEATAVAFPDGRFIKSVFGSHLVNTVRTDAEALSFAVSVRLSDLKFVVDELERLNADADSPFVGELDLSRVALSGHSLGGLTVTLGVEEEPRFKAGIIIDGVMPGALANATETPMLILAAGSQQWGAEECRLWGNLRGPRFALNLRGAEHVTPSDAVWLANGVIKTGDMGPEKTIAAIRDYIAAFLDANLRGQPVDPLLTGPSSDYPDAAVTTQNEPLSGCSVNPR